MSTYRRKKKAKKRLNKLFKYFFGRDYKKKFLELDKDFLFKPIIAGLPRHRDFWQIAVPTPAYKSAPEEEQHEYLLTQIRYGIS